MKEIKVELQEWMGSDRSIAESAWTSSIDYQKKKSKSDGDVARILNMLADSKHSVPFESVVLRFWLKLPIQTDRQLMTHRIGSHSGLSGRYRTMPDNWLSIPDDVLSIINKSGLISIEYDYHELCQKANDWYRGCLIKLKELENQTIISNKEYKRVREFIRGVIPLNNITERVTIMNLRSFCNFYKLRSKTDAQPEIQYVAKLMMEQLKEKNMCPIAISALERNNWII